MCTYGRFMLMFDRKQNSIKQLSFNLKINKVKKICKKEIGKEEIKLSLFTYNMVFSMLKITRNQQPQQ